MGPKRAPGVPTALARTENRVLRPGDFTDLYTNPHAEFARMVRTGVLDKLAHGYYLLIPEESRAGHWHPEIEPVALGIAVADYGRDDTALMGPAAARILGAIPRALGTATVAVPKQRPSLRTKFGTIEFVTRKVGALDLQRADTGVVVGWVTTPEQTALDVADRPVLGGITPNTAAEAIRFLATRADPEAVQRLAFAQHKRAAWQRYCWVVGLPVPVPLRQGATTRGLVNPALRAADYGLVERAA